MLKGILFLIAFGLSPWWLSLLAARLEIPLPFSAMLSSWLRADDGEFEIGHDRPPDDWREARYFASNPDVLAAVRRGDFRSGYEHYLRYGRNEGRSNGFLIAPQVPEPVKSVVVAAISEPPPAPMAAAPAEPSPLAHLPLTEEPPMVLPGRKPNHTLFPSPPPDPQQVPPSREAEPLVKPTGGQIMAIRSATHPGFIRVVLDSTTALMAERVASRNQRGVEIALAAAWQPPRQGKLSRKSMTYRVESSGGGIRLLVESSDAIHIKALFALPPEQFGGRHRLILDVAPGG